MMTISIARGTHWSIGKFRIEAIVVHSEVKNGFRIMNSGGDCMNLLTAVKDGSGERALYVQ